MFGKYWQRSWRVCRCCREHIKLGFVQLPTRCIILWRLELVAALHSDAAVYESSAVLFCYFRPVARVGLESTDLYKYSQDHVVTDKPPPPPPLKMATSSGLFLATIYNQSQLAERKHVARYWSIKTGNGGSIKRAPLSVSYYNEISGGHIGRGLFRGGLFCRPSTAPVLELRFARFQSPQNTVPSLCCCLVSK